MEFSQMYYPVDNLTMSQYVFSRGANVFGLPLVTAKNLYLTFPIKNWNSSWLYLPYAEVLFTMYVPHGPRMETVSPYRSVITLH